jgi:hypothetical protein
MGDPSHSSAPETAVDALLEERARYEQWLTKLDEAGRNTSEGVRDRIRQDYRDRLNRVLGELREHAQTIRADLARHRGEQAELEARQTQTRERLAEAELRHAVGEFGAEEWQRISDEASRQLAEVGGSLSRVSEEISRLAEVEQLIGHGPAPASAAPPLEPPARVAPDRPSGPVPEPDPTQVPIGLPADLPAAGVPADQTMGMPDGAGHTGQGRDELAFLRSVTDSEPAPAAQPAAPAPAQTATAPQRIAPLAPNGAAASNRTLKCTECQTMNRPTEWYCERCGAELSAL